jgi:hypothetical protein
MEAMIILVLNLLVIKLMLDFWLPDWDKNFNRWIN